MVRFESVGLTESNNTAYANMTVLQNSPNGLVAFNITAYDGAGNEFNVTQDGAYANVIIDTVNPALSNLTIYSNNAHNRLLQPGSDMLLNITITANEASPGSKYHSIRHYTYDDELAQLLVQT